MRKYLDEVRQQQAGGQQKAGEMRPPLLRLLPLLLLSVGSPHACTAAAGKCPLARTRISHFLPMISYVITAPAGRTGVHGSLSSPTARTAYKSSAQHAIG